MHLELEIFENSACLAINLIFWWRSFEYFLALVAISIFFLSPQAILKIQNNLVLRKVWPLLVSSIHRCDLSAPYEFLNDNFKTKNGSRLWSTYFCNFYVICTPKQVNRLCSVKLQFLHFTIRVSPVILPSKPK